MAKRKKRRIDAYSENSPFIIRQPLLRLWQMILFGLGMTATIYASIYFGSNELRNFIVMLFGVLIIILFYFIQNIYFDEKTATEFQSSIFSGAMRSHTMLSFILYQNCGIYYFDQRYSSVFRNNGPMHNFDNIMDNLGITAKEQEKITTAIHDLKLYEFEHKFFNSEKRYDLLIGVYPIQRPKGYVNLAIYKLHD